MRIMTNSYIKGPEYYNKFKNRLEKDMANDEEYQRFKEEQLNTKKMSTILMSLNVPFKRNKTVQNSVNQSALRPSPNRKREQVHPLKTQ